MANITMSQYLNALDASRKGIYLNALINYPLINRIPRPAGELTLEGYSFWRKPSPRDVEFRALNTDFTGRSGEELSKVTIRPAILGDSFGVDLLMTKKDQIGYTATNIADIQRDILIKANDKIINGDKVSSLNKEFDGLDVITQAESQTDTVTTAVTSESTAKTVVDALVDIMRSKMLVNSLMVTNTDGLKIIDKLQFYYQDKQLRSPSMGPDWRDINNVEVIHAGYQYDETDVIANRTISSEEYVDFYILNFAPDTGLQFMFEVLEPVDSDSGNTKTWSVNALAALIPRTKFAAYRLSVKK